MGFLSKVVSKGLRKVGVSKKSANRAGHWIANPARAAQRSHVFGKIGKSLAPSADSRNALSKAWSKLQTALSKSAERQVARSQTTSSAASVGRQLQSSPLDITANRVDYRYRRLADLIADEQYRGK